MSDGGEGLLEALGGTVHRADGTGPAGAPVDAEWRMLPARTGRRRPPGPTAVIEMSRAAGRALLPDPRGDEPVRADTAGVGTLLLAARDAGARRIVVGCGGSATTDGGWGAYDTVGSAGRSWPGSSSSWPVTSRRRSADAARVFGPQKGATPTQVAAAVGPPRYPRRSLPARLRGRRHRRARRRGGRRAGRGAGRAGRPHESTDSTSWRGWSVWTPGWPGPIWSSPGKGTSTPLRSTARCPVASAGPGGRAMPVLCIAAGPTRRSCARHRRGWRSSASPSGSGAPGPGRRRRH